VRVATSRRPALSVASTHALRGGEQQASEFVSTRAVRAAAITLVTCLSLGATGCEERVDPGTDFSVADLIFDASFFYCRVEPMLFAQSCGAGSEAGESSANCHHTQTSFRLIDYSPLFADACGGGVVPTQGTPPNEAQQNYQRAQAKMNRDPEKAALLLRPAGIATHPRVIFDENSPEADLIREWATKFTAQ
jgi:hypothetical protein